MNRRRTILPILMKKDNKLYILALLLMTCLCGCAVQKNETKSNAFLYRPFEYSPAYIVKLPPGCKIEYVIYQGERTYGYAFSYHDATFYISDGNTYFDKSYNVHLRDSLYNSLLEMQKIYKSGKNINIPIKGTIYLGGGAGSFWRDCLYYNLENSNHLFGVSNIGFEHLYVVYANASERDTAVLNECISSAIRVEKPVKRHRANKIIKYSFNGKKAQ